MAKGAPNRSSGWAKAAALSWRPWAVAAGLSLIVALINATSVIIEWERAGRAIDPREPFIWEYSSCLLILALAPLIGVALAWAPPRRDTLLRFLATHAALTIPYSLAHVGGMVALRKLAYALMGEGYNFSGGNLPLELLYEWRKDVVGYLLIGAIYWYFQHRAAEAAAKPPPPERIEIRDGAAAYFLPHDDILWIEAAGNYVQVHTSGRSHLVRGTLASWEAKLAPRNFARVHRSRLVNRGKVRALKSTPAGDLEITLDNGAVVAGSRRYRAALEAA